MQERGPQTGKALHAGADVVQKSVPHQLERQGNAIESLEGRLESLRDRLSPILSMRPTELKNVNQAESGKPSPSAGCDIATSINSKSRRIEDMVIAIEDLLDRIEL